MVIVSSFQLSRFLLFTNLIKLDTERRSDNWYYAGALWKNGCEFEERMSDWSSEGLIFG